MSFSCPTCEKPAACFDSRPGSGGVTKRRWKCPAGHRFSTVEQLAFTTIGGTGNTLASEVSFRERLEAIDQMRRALDQMAAELERKHHPALKERGVVSDEINQKCSEG